MDYSTLPPFPTNLGFSFKGHSVTQMAELWDCHERTIYRMVELVSDILGPRTGNDYQADHIIILSLIYSPPEKYWHFIKWIETHGWKEYYVDVYKLHKWIDPSARAELKRQLKEGKTKNKRRK